jgi:anti-sigma B factor antagonist
MLAMTIQSLGDVVILRCAGRIVAGNESNLLQKAVLSQLDKRTLVLDLAQVEIIDGGGIGLLVSLQVSARTAGTEFKLMNPTHSVRELLELTHLDSVFAISASEDTRLRRPVSAADDTPAYRYD